jgi:hypothetical protein
LNKAEDVGGIQNISQVKFPVCCQLLFQVIPVYCRGWALAQSARKLYQYRKNAVFLDFHPKANEFSKSLTAFLFIANLFDF